MIHSDGERQAPKNLEEAEVTHLARYRFALRFARRDETCLDAPCGSGYGTALLSGKSKSVYGVDINRGAINHAKEFFSKPNSYFGVADIENIVFEDDSFDRIISFEGIEHIQNPGSFLSEARRILKPGGAMIISTPRKPHGSPYHIREFSLDEFKGELSQYFNVRNVFGQIYTDIFSLEKKVNPMDYKKFNFIAYCT